MSAVDPVNDTDFWTIQEYAYTNSTAYEDITDGWATGWAKVGFTTPGNDFFTDAITISGAQGSTNGTLLRSWYEAGEPFHGGSANLPSVWYQWTAPAAGYVKFQASGSMLGANVAIYTGTSVGSLTLVTNGVASAGVVFEAANATTYRIAVAGNSGPVGSFTLTWLQTNAPLFTLQPHSWDVFKGSNITFSSTASGSPAPAYQWRFLGTNSSGGTNIPGATSASLSLTNVQTNQTGNFLVVATNTLGAATSVVAHLQVYATQQALLDDWVYASNAMQFIVSGITGANYVVEASTNLLNWVSIYTNQTTFTNIDGTVTNYAYRFYRALYSP